MTPNSHRVCLFEVQLLVSSKVGFLAFVIIFSFSSQQKAASEASFLAFQKPDQQLGCFQMAEASKMLKQTSPYYRNKELIAIQKMPQQYAIHYNCNTEYKLTYLLKINCQFQFIISFLFPFGCKETYFHICSYSNWSNMFNKLETGHSSAFSHF